MRKENRINLLRFIRTALLSGIAVLAMGMLSLTATSASAAATTSGSHRFPAARLIAETGPEFTPAPGLVSSGTPREDRHIFKLRHNGTTQTETCYGDTDIGYSAAYPGFIEGRAWVVGCTPYRAVFCTQTADMQTYDTHSHMWVYDGDGPTKEGCAGVADASGIKKNCLSTEETFYYRTFGIWVVFDSRGDKLDWGAPGTTLSIERVC